MRDPKEDRALCPGSGRPPIDDGLWREEVYRREREADARAWLILEAMWEHEDRELAEHEALAKFAADHEAATRHYRRAR